jgi:hypothetical protein
MRVVINSVILFCIIMVFSACNESYEKEAKEGFIACNKEVIPVIDSLLASCRLAIVQTDNEKETSFYQAQELNEPVVAPLRYPMATAESSFDSTKVNTIVIDVTAMKFDHPYVTDDFGYLELYSLKPILLAENDDWIFEGMKYDGYQIDHVHKLFKREKELLAQYKYILVIKSGYQFRGESINDVEVSYDHMDKLSSLVMLYGVTNGKLLSRQVMETEIETANGYGTSELKQFLGLKMIDVIQQSLKSLKQKKK